MAEAWRAQALAALRQGAAQLDVPLTVAQQEKLLDYVALLHKWNRAYNLTAVRDPVDMTRRHVLDALAVVPHIPQRRLLDVGTGPGIPGVILAIVWPQAELTLLDSNGKKTRFVRSAVRELGLENVAVAQARVERFQVEAPFPAIISRAFAELGDFVRLTRHLLADDGRWWGMKGHVENELARLPDDVAVARIIELAVPFETARRSLIELRKR